MYRVGRLVKRASTDSVLVVILAVSSGCTPVVTPTSVAEHEAAARAEERYAAEHEAEFDPEAEAEVARPPGVCPPFPRGSGACWSPVVNPTQAHLAEADEHHRRASAHRKAAQALARAEDRHCRGLSDYERDVSPFQNLRDIARVDVEHEFVAVTFERVEGLTVDALRRIIDCHLARNAAVGHDMPEMDDCPLVPRGVRVAIDETEGKLRVEIRTNDPAMAEEVAARGRRLQAAVAAQPREIR